MIDLHAALTVIEEEDDPTAWERIKQYAELTEGGIRFHQNGSMPIELYGKLCGGIGQIGEAHRWWVGDALNYGERTYHEDYAQFEDLLGYSYHTLQQYRRVAARIPLEERDPKIPWTAYQITAHLEPETRETLIEGYVEGRIETTTDLRDEVRDLKTGLEANLLPPCPRCGGKLGSRQCRSCGLDFTAAIGWIGELLHSQERARRALLGLED